jgi:hypothetical protein
MESEYNPNEAWILEVAFIEDIVILSILALVEALLFIRLRCKIDLSGIFLLLLTLAVAILRVLKGQDTLKEHFTIINVICQLLIWFALYYFTFDL